MFEASADARVNCRAVYHQQATSFSQSLAMYIVVTSRPNGHASVKCQPAANRRQQPQRRAPIWAQAGGDPIANGPWPRGLQGCGSAICFSARPKLAKGGVHATPPEHGCRLNLTSSHLDQAYPETPSTISRPIYLCPSNLSLSLSLDSCPSWCVQSPPEPHTHHTSPSYPAPTSAHSCHRINLTRPILTDYMSS
jgi:hypothetical protein